jgi:hypothetical protein
MDDDRQPRYLIPPVDLAPLLIPKTLEAMLGLLAATGVVILPLGFVLGTISINILRLIGWFARLHSYEAAITDESYRLMCGQIHVEAVAGEPRWKLFVAATFDHEVLSPGVSAWLRRRWSNFNISCHSAVALLLAHAVAPLVQIGQTASWWLTTLLLGSLLVFNAYRAWSHTVMMLELQAHRQQSGR